MSEQQIKEYLQKYNITSKELLASHIEELKRNTKPNTKLISELVWVLNDFFFSFFERSSCPDEKEGKKWFTSSDFMEVTMNVTPQKSLNNHVSEVIDTKLGEYARTELEPDYRPPFFLDEAIKASEIPAQKTEKEENLVFPKDSEIHKEESIDGKPCIALPYNYTQKDIEESELKLKERGIKESNGKINYEELDWDYIDLMVLRMSKNLEKYPPKNWQKKMNIKKLAEASIRHARKIIQEIENDEESLQEHSIALGCNGMMINFQLKNVK